MTCSDLYQRKYLQMIIFSFLCVKIQLTDIIWIYWGLLQNWWMIFMRRLYLYNIKLNNNDMFWFISKKILTDDNFFIPLCKNSIDRYYLNILRIITLTCQIYIEYEWYNLEHNKQLGIIFEHQFINSTMGKWDDQYIFIKIFINRGNWIYVKLWKK